MGALCHHSIFQVLIEHNAGHTEEKQSSQCNSKLFLARLLSGNITVFYGCVVLLSLMQGWFITCVQDLKVHSSPSVKTGEVSFFSFPPPAPESSIIIVFKWVCFLLHVYAMKETLFYINTASYVCSGFLLQCSQGINLQKKKWNAFLGVALCMFPFGLIVLELYLFQLGTCYWVKPLPW